MTSVLKAEAALAKAIRQLESEKNKAKSVKLGRREYRTFDDACSSLGLVPDIIGMRAKKLNIDRTKYLCGQFGLLAQAKDKFIYGELK